jgi:hypothetical protein
VVEHLTVPEVPFGVQGRELAVHAIRVGDVTSAHMPMKGPFGPRPNAEAEVEVRIEATINRYTPLPSRTLHVREKISDYPVAPTTSDQQNRPSIDRHGRSKAIFVGRFHGLLSQSSASAKNLAEFRRRWPSVKLGTCPFSSSNSHAELMLAREARSGDGVAPDARALAAVTDADDGRTAQRTVCSGLPRVSRPSPCRRATPASRFDGI